MVSRAQVARALQQFEALGRAARAAKQACRSEWGTEHELRFVAQLPRARLAGYRQALERRVEWGDVERDRVIAALDARIGMA